jgi:hypothetical protein
MKQKDSKLKVLDLTTKATIFDLNNELNALKVQISRAKKAKQDIARLEKNKDRLLAEINRLKNSKRL